MDIVKLLTILIVFFLTWGIGVALAGHVVGFLVALLAAILTGRRMAPSDE